MLTRVMIWKLVHSFIHSCILLLIIHLSIQATYTEHLLCACQTHARDEALSKKYKALFHGAHIVVEEDRKQARTPGISDVMEKQGKVRQNVRGQLRLVNIVNSNFSQIDIQIQCSP